MDADLKKILKAVVLAMRHSLEGKYNETGFWQPGDLESRLAEIGVRQDRESVPAEEMPNLTQEDQHARRVVDGYLKLRLEAGVLRGEAVREFVRESAYTWANRLLALRCMEARELIDEAILQKSTYGGRSLEHHRLIQRNPELSETPDDGRFAMLTKVFTEQAKRLPNLFDPSSPSIALRPSPAALKQCWDWLSGSLAVRSQPAATDEVFQAPDALGWAYQYWNTDEKKRVFDMVKTVKGAKIAGADIVPATQLYTEDYMVKFLVQNSLGATWRGMYPESNLGSRIVGGESTVDDQTQKSVWGYYVEDADRVPVRKKPVREITLLDPACGSGHFLIEAFDMFYDMYVEEGVLSEPSAICSSILENNLFGIDIDLRAIQIAEVALWMKAAERVVEFDGAPTGLVAAVASHLKGESWERFLSEKFIDEPSVPRVLRKFALAMTNIDQLGTLARPAEELEEIIREEHETWEKQKAAGKDSNFLFSEMLDDALAGQLPFREMSDEQFGQRIMKLAIAAIDDFTKDARDRQEFDDSLLGSEAKRGFRLLQLLSAKYDVVVANPPYMGSRKMGGVLKKHIGEHFKPGKRDLYTSFLLRNLKLVASGGRVAMITLHTWMFLNSFDKLRKQVLDQSRLNLIAHLGRHAFSEADPPGNAAMIVFTALHAEKSSKTVSYRLTAPRPANEQAALLKSGISGLEVGISHSTIQDNFNAVPGTPIVYWIDDAFFELLTSNNRVEHFGGVKQGLATGDNSRYLRLHWELPARMPHWAMYAKGGGFCKWFGLQTHLVDWRQDGAFFNGNPKARYQNAETYLNPGITYTLMARGSLGLRLMDNSVYDVASMSIFPSAEYKHWIMGVLNCRLLSYIARVISQDIKFNTSYVSSLPLPISTNQVEIENLACFCVDVKKKLVSLNPVELTCDPEMLFSMAKRSMANVQLQTFLMNALLLTLEGIIEQLVINAYALTQSAVEEAIRETGTPTGWFELLAGHDAWHKDFRMHINDVSLPLRFFSALKKRTLSDSERDAKLSTLERVYAAGPGEATEDELELESVDLDDEDKDEDEGLDKESNIGQLPVRSESFFEDLSNSTQLHPVSVFQLLEHGVQQLGWSCKPENSRIAKDLLTFAVLRELGHKWGSSTSEQWSLQKDAPGIIALYQVAGQQNDQFETLWLKVNRLLEQRLGSGRSESIIGEMRECLDSTPENWLPASFFKHHVSQFKKRPPVWHLQSTPLRDAPIFGCMVYGANVNFDTLPKIRSQFVNPIRQRLETELRGIPSAGSSDLSDAQKMRREKLEDSVEELQKFDGALDTLALNGFGPPSIFSVLRQSATCEATLALKTTWLRRLSSFILETEVDQWCRLAADSNLYPELQTSIRNSIVTLNYHCVDIGVSTPSQESFQNDPTSAELAALICVASSEMSVAAIKRSCEVWWKQLEEAVFQPLKDRAKKLKDDQAKIESRLEELQAQEDLTLSKIGELKEAIKRVKSELKIINADLKTKTAAAKKLREKIEAWRSDEPTKWGDWLAEQPMFDQISSLDDRRPPPKTIAEFIAQESMYVPDINDGVRVNIAPLQKAGILAAEVLAPKDVDKAIADRAEWRADERRWVRKGILPRPGWWPERDEQTTEVAE